MFIAGMIGLGLGAVVFGSLLCGRAVRRSPVADGSGASDASSAVKVGRGAQSVVGVALIALGSLWALLSLIVFAIFDGDMSVGTYASFLGRPRWASPSPSWAACSVGGPRGMALAILPPDARAVRESNREEDANSKRTVGS